MIPAFFQAADIVIILYVWLGCMKTGWRREKEKKRGKGKKKCRDTGLQISNGGGNNTISNVTSTYNYDPKTKGENAFWAEYSKLEKSIYKDLLANHKDR